MLDLSLSSAIEKNKVSSETPFLILLQITVYDPVDGSYVERINLVKNNESVVWHTKTYTPFPFDIGFNYETGSIPEVTLTIEDYSKAIQSRMQAYGGGLGFGVRMNIVNHDNILTDNRGQFEEPDYEENFTVSSASVSDYVVTWSLSIPNPLTKAFPRRRQLKDRCPWTYKGAECRYEGALPSCSFTLLGANGCAAHNNTVNFGGYPGIARGNVRFA